MERYLNMAIKSVITEFPQIGIILNDYEIGCVTYVSKKFTLNIMTDVLHDDNLQVQEIQ